MPNDNQGPKRPKPEHSQRWERKRTTGKALQAGTEDGYIIWWMGHASRQVVRKTHGEGGLVVLVVHRERPEGHIHMCVVCGRELSAQLPVYLSTKGRTLLVY